jgi:ADP-heptose:LPS heptosyltransferase
MNLGIFIAMSDGTKYPIQSIGDTLGLTTLIKEIYNTTGFKSSIATLVPEIFKNNPYVEKVYTGHFAESELTPCTEYSCNIIQNYFTQFSLPSPENPIPEIYLSDDEKEYAQKELEEFKDKKKIAVCLKSSADSRDLRYEKILPLLLKLKNQGYILIGVGQDLLQEDEIFNKSFINKTTLREVFSIINECDFYLGVDTGLFHAAAALNKPQVVFFRHNGCSNNAYSSTYYIDSSLICPNFCHMPWVANCPSEVKCMDMFNFEQYYKMIISKFSI